MKIRIHDTDLEGNPLECSGEFFTGTTALDIVEGMKMNPFNAHLEPLEFMRLTLDRIAQKAFRLPENEPGKAAIVFLQRLTALGYAKYELEDGDINAGRTAERRPVADGKGQDSMQSGKHPVGNEE